MKPTYSDAIIALGIEGAFSTKDGKITKWLTNETQPSEEAIQAKLKELQADYDAKQYQRDRALAFPSWQEQLDMQYWDQVNGTTKWKEAIAKVKSDNPKP